MPSFLPALTAARMAALILAAGLALASCTFDLDYDKYAIVYGISDYPSGYSDLSSTDDDAMAMEELLASQGFQVTVRITDDATVSIIDVPDPDPDIVDEATYNRLELDFQDIAGQADLYDLFIFYFSGHGKQILAGSSENTPGSDPEDEAIVLVNDTLSDVEYLIDDTLADWLRTIPCARKVVILDSCYSGGFVSNPLEGDAIPPDYSHEGPKGLFETLGDAFYLYANFQDYGSDISPDVALVIAASGEQDVAYEDEDNGIMTGFLLESATEADYNLDGYITVSESYLYIYRNIIEHFNMVYGPSGFAFFPDISGGPVDYILFTK
jgi:hypothetical protein